MIRLIRFSYRKIIDASCRKPWDKYVFEDTHMEFYMQAQYYDRENKYPTFQQLLSHVPGASRLHTQVSTAASGYIRQLEGTIPDIANVSGKLCLPFKTFKFEIIQSHVTDKSQHKVAIVFESEAVCWLDTVGGTMLVAGADQVDALRVGSMIETDMLVLQPFLSIASCQVLQPLAHGEYATSHF